MSRQIIPISFLAAILVGTLLLLLPFSTAKGETTSLLTALFTATTSVCVTGLVVADTFSHWSLFGHIVILVLIQLGGFGVITVTSMIMLMAKKHFSLADRTLLQDAMNLDTRSGLLGFLRRVVKATFLVEGAGAFLYCFAFIPEFGPVKGIWVSVFTAISAFCNAGIDIIGPDSLIRYNQNPLVMGVTMALIVLGGLGYVVWFDVITKGKANRRPNLFVRRLGEHTKLVLALTAVLLAAGTLAVYLAEGGNPGTLGPMKAGDKWMNALFQSVTFRTAGFAAVPQQELTPATCAAGYFLMFIGGSPVGTAGGVKTVTVAIVILNAVSYIRGRRDTVIFRRSVSEELIRKSSAIVAVSISAVILLTILLLLTNPVSFTDGLYESVSALATVGLTRGLTPSLNGIGRILIIIGMFLGRIGPISMALFFTRAGGGSGISLAEGRFYAG